MGQDEGRRGDDAFDVDDILPELGEFDPDLDDLLDLSETPDLLSAPPPPPPAPPRRPSPIPRPSSWQGLPGPPEPERRPDPDPAPAAPRRPEPTPPPAPAGDDDLEIPHFVRSESEPEADPATTAWSEPEPDPEPDPEAAGGYEEFGDVGGVEEPGGYGEGPAEEPVWPAEEPAYDRLDAHGFRTSGADAGEVDDLIPPEPEGPAFIDRFVEQRSEERREPATDAEPEPPEAPLEGPSEEPPEAVESELPSDPLRPDHEPAAVPPPEQAPPRMPETPPAEIDGFAAQLGDLLSTGEPPSPGGDPGSQASVEFTVDDDMWPAAEAVPDPGMEGQEAAPAPSAVATLAPTPAEVVPILPPLPRVDAGPPPCTGNGHHVDAVGVGAPERHWVRRASIAFLALAAAAAVLLTNPRAGSDGEPAPSSEGSAPVAGEAQATEPQAAEAETPAIQLDPGVNLVAEGTVPLVDVYPTPEAGAAALSLENPTEVGGPLVFLVDEQRDGWLRVFLPGPPVDGSTEAPSGWIRTDQVTLSQHEFRVEIRLSERRLELFDGDDPVFGAAIAVGGPDAPEVGRPYFIKELLKPPSPDTVYGEYAFGLSGTSNTLEKFNAGDGVVAIHGADDPTVISTDVAVGSIYLTNSEISELVGKLPLGTPVEVVE